MDTEQEDVWYNWLGSSSRFLRGSPKTEKNDCTVIRKRPVSKVEEHIHNLTESLSKTQAALERAGEAEEEARREHAGCSEALAKQEAENVRLEHEISKVYEEIESCHWKQGSDAVDHQRLEHRIQELVEQVKRAEQEAEDNRGIMANERLIHLQERETLVVVQTEHEDCLASLRVAQDILAEYSRDVAFRDATIQELKRNKTRMASKLSHFTSSLRTTSKELGDTKRRLAQVSDQLTQAEHIIQTHFTMLSSLETYKQKLTEELDHLRTSYDNRTMQLVNMRETLQDKNSIIADLREELEDRDNELHNTKLDVASAHRQLAETLDDLDLSRQAAAAAEDEIDEMREQHQQVDDERARQISELDQGRLELEAALEMVRQENGLLKSELEVAAIDAATKDEKLAQEIAAHGRTSEAAAAQKLRLQNSIENLKSNLTKANSDLRRTRETLFALNEKCHNIAKAQVSLSSYRAKSKLLVDTQQQGPEREISGSLESSIDDDNCSETSEADRQHHHGEEEQQQQSPNVNTAFTMKAQAQEESTAPSAPPYSRSLSGDTMIETTTPTCSTATTPANEHPPLRLSLPKRDSLFEPPQVVASPKSVRFDLASDEGYQTDEDKAVTDDKQMWNIISNLDRARKDFKVLRKRQRRRNLKTEAAVTAAAAATVAVQ